MNLYNRHADTQTDTDTHRHRHTQLPNTYVFKHHHHHTHILLHPRNALYLNESIEFTGALGQVR